MTDCLGGLQVDDEFEPSRLLDGKIGRLGAPQHFNDQAFSTTAGMAAVTVRAGPIR